MKFERPTKIKPGDAFGRLMVIRRVANHANGKPMFLCACRCGTEKTVAGTGLQSGDTKSCGCLKRETSSKHVKTRLRKDYGVALAHRVFCHYLDAAKKRGHAFELTKEQFMSFTQRQCYYCGKPPSTVAVRENYFGKFVYNGIDRRDNTAGYTLENSFPCCKECNKAKGTMSHAAFIAMAIRIVNHRVKCRAPEEQIQRLRIEPPVQSIQE
jgi:hypothetical protein